MGARRSSREAALQMLYALDARSARREDGGGTAPPKSDAPASDTTPEPPVLSYDSDEVERVIADFWRELPGDVEGRDYADRVVRGVGGDLPRIDERIRAASRHWRVERMARVDRNLLRMGVFELASSNEVPRPVVIDEAVELAKRYGSEGSSVFVNGVLDRIAEDLGR
jgi:N utilization substance protein B